MSLQDMQQAMLQMVDCLCTKMAEIAAAGGPEVCLCTLLPGDAVPFDYCGGDDCGGMAWVRLVGLMEDEQEVRNVCFVPLVATIEMGVVRGVQFDGEILPDEEDQLAMSIRQMDDMLAMQQALACCAVEHRFRVGAYNPLGPQGGCYGGTWTISMEV